MGADKTFSVQHEGVTRASWKWDLLARQYVAGGDVGVALIVLWL